MFQKLLWGSLNVLFFMSAAGWAGESQIGRGKYLVEEVAKCADCHTPHLATGELDKDNWLKGAKLAFAPSVPIPDWHATAPDLTPTGRIWSNWGEAKLVQFLNTGLAPHGKPAGPPMPMYTMKTADAKAIVAYLKSLK